MESGFFGVYLWKNRVKKAKSMDVAAVTSAAGGTTFKTPERKVKIDGANHHTFKKAWVRKIRPDGLIDEVWSSKAPIELDPYLKKRVQARSLSAGK